MKRLFFTLTLVACAWMGKAQDAAQWFQLPTVPENLEMLQDRTDYMVEHYWDFCDLKKAFSARDKMAQAFDTYVSFMPYASADVVYKSVEAFMDRLEKQPKDMLYIGELAEGKLYSDTAEMISDDLYLAFIEPIIQNKRVDKTAKLRYQHQARTLSQSRLGSVAPAFEYEDIYGEKGTFAVDTARIGTVLFFNDPECGDCRMARIRLDADIRTSKLVEDGVMDIVSVLASDPEDYWREQAVSYPQKWKVVASEMVNEMYDLRHTPMFYVLNPNGAILLKTSDVEAIINIMAQLSARLSR